MYKLTQQIVSKQVGPAEANAFLAINNFDGQRPLNVPKVKQYCDMMNNGSMRPVGIAVATLKYENDRKVLMNGQHVCQAIVARNKPHQAMVEYYKCEDPKDAWMLFASFDTHCARTQQHVVKAARGLFAHAELRDLPIRVLTLCGSAFVMLGSGTVAVFSSYSNMPKTVKPELCDKYFADVVWVAEYHENKHLMRTGIVTAMIASHRASPKEADEFWGTVACGIGIKQKSDPRYQLREALLDHKDAGGGGNRGIYRDYCVCVAWWNSWATGVSRKIVKVSAMTEPPRAMPYKLQ